MIPKERTPARSARMVVQPPVSTYDSWGWSGHSWLLELLPGILWPCGCTDQQLKIMNTNPSILPPGPVGRSAWKIFLRNPMGTRTLHQALQLPSHTKHASGTSQEDSGSGNKWQGAMSTNWRQQIACVCVWAIVPSKYYMDILYIRHV